MTQYTHLTTLSGKTLGVSPSIPTHRPLTDTFFTSLSASLNKFLDRAGFHLFFPLVHLGEVTYDAVITICGALLQIPLIFVITFFLHDKRILQVHPSGDHVGQLFPFGPSKLRVFFRLLSQLRLSDADQVRPGYVTSLRAFAKEVLKHKT